MRAAIFLFLLLSLAGRVDAGDQWNTTITVNSADGKPSACHLWLPDGVKRIRAIFCLQNREPGAF